MHMSDVNNNNNNRQQQQWQRQRRILDELRQRDEITIEEVRHELCPDDMKKSTIRFWSIDYRTLRMMAGMATVRWDA